ncbi:hypothetical protein [Paenibacillus sp. Soil522]|uniref:hypothetical protein n=1 Tax=Paenibacillus sp. Soil522 TaxID=1736388 RepID=UPI0006FA9ADA|nr:hypothetical protein [Paenibacillus sp. Soil522]KRE23698.1 hypothetical protein ASG81_28310 [Paenibacillus sp. Soil522]
MRIKIPNGYAIINNKFHDVDPIQAEEKDDLLSNWEYFTEDIMHIQKLENVNGRYVIPESNARIIDLGWYPDSSINGEYRLVLVDEDWNELKTKQSKDRFEIRDTIEIWLRELNNNQPDDGF